MGKNCWEAKGCGRQPGGAKAADLGICPAATESKLNGVNNGKNGGRSCWAIAGTLCGGTVQGDHAKKEANCLACEYYKTVRSEEGAKFAPLATILQRLS